MARPSGAAEKAVGTVHLHSGKPCQDEVGFIEVGERIAIAVSDGHGSAKYADVGSRLAVMSALYALTLFAEAFDGRPVHELHGLARDVLRKNIQRGWVDAVRAYGSGDTSDLRTHGATLGFALSTPNAVIIGDIGDCDVLLVDADGKATRPVRAREYVGEQTSSLCLPESEIDFYTAVLPAPEAETLLILTTDGYSKSYSTDGGFELIGKSYLDMIRTEGLAAVAAKLPKILAQTTERGSGDDISIAMLYWPPKSRDTTKLEVTEAVAPSPSTETLAADARSDAAETAPLAATLEEG
jgi:serine/threonine protein phosphatase PrpC